MFKHLMEIVHNHDNDHLDWLFHWNIFPVAKGSQLRNYLEVHSLSSDQVFLPISLKTCSKFSGWTFKCFFLLFNCRIVYFRDRKQLSTEMTELFSISLNGHNWF